MGAANGDRAKGFVMSTAREQWLIQATNKLRNGIFQEQGHYVPTVRISVGFPGGGSARKRIGEYWHAKACDDGIPQIFISPVLKSRAEILDTLVHELVHAVTPGGGHGREFKRVAESVGLTGPMRATVAGSALVVKLQELAAELGEFPHAGINLSDRKKQTTRLVKCECPECGYIARTTAKWIEEKGAPLCPCNSEPMQAS
jgi:hypothetical protein